MQPNNTGLFAIKGAVLASDELTLKEYGLLESKEAQKLRKINYDVLGLDRLVSDNVVTLTEEQKLAYDAIMM